MEALEGTAEDHETMISSTESDVIGNTECINLFQSNYNIQIQQRMSSSQRQNFDNCHIIEYGIFLNFRFGRNCY